MNDYLHVDIHSHSYLFYNHPYTFLYQINSVFLVKFKVLFFFLFLLFLFSSIFPRSLNACQPTSPAVAQICNVMVMERAFIEAGETLESEGIGPTFRNDYREIITVILSSGAFPPSFLLFLYSFLGAKMG